MSGTAAFLNGFADSFRDRRDSGLRAAEIEAGRGAIREATPDFVPQPGRAAVPQPGEYTPQQGAGGTSAKPYETGDPVATDMAPHQRAFLNSIAGGESGGKYNVRYTPKGAATFDSFSQHPRTFEKGPHGLSSAAGRYQFTASTWDDLGGGSFEEANQDRKAWQLATQRYAATTGRDLDADLRTQGLTPGVLSSLSPTWAAFKSNGDRHIATYNDSLARYGASPQGATAQAPMGRGILPDAPPARPKEYEAFGIKFSEENPLAKQAWAKMRGA